MTNQERASYLLQLWQTARAAGIPPEDRLPVPANDGDSFEADLEVLRKVLDRRV